MSEVIKVEKLSKLYRLGLVGRNTIAEDLHRFWAKVRGKEDPFLKIGETNDRTIKGTSDFAWALKDINFEVKDGERIGIIGKNGAGKSTLLKILSRVASPTKGIVRVKGRVASLLEVGTGFHPELTGRDNIFLNGSILGMTQNEIKKKFDSIVDFSAVERYIDTPVKRYSSGMYVRLAFAVAAHLEPEILIVDEVLAVGDTEFQKKCLGKMHEVSEQEGRTVIFVSHNLQAIKNLCERTLVLNNGELYANGPTEESLEAYYDLIKETKIDANTGINFELNRRGFGTIRFTGIEVMGPEGISRYKFEVGESIRFKLSYEVFKEIHGITITIALLSGMSKECLTLAHYEVTNKTVLPGTAGELEIEFTDIDIKPGEYPLYFELTDSRLSSHAKDVIDNLTAPLVISAKQNSSLVNTEKGEPSGFFNIPTRLISSEISSKKILTKAL